ncbi:hypothetical protein RV18_GL001406 [Enterococcus termitis]|nr:hypothetical protein RV18_GL001406 [Enterococcus termitis]
MIREFGYFAPVGRQVLFIICSGEASRSDSQQKALILQKGREL